MFSDIIRRVISQKESISLELQLVDELLNDIIGRHYESVTTGKKLRATLFFQFFNKFSSKQSEFAIKKGGPPPKPPQSDLLLGDTEHRSGVYLGVHEHSSTGSTKEETDCGGLGGGSNIWTAALIEAIHFASIVHDDIIDDSSRRRGNLSFHKSFGRKFGILFGDYIFTNASKRFLDLYKDNRLIQRIFLRECSSTILGAIREQELSIASDISECLRITSLKTSPFFKLSCFLGAYLASGNFKEAIKCATFGTCFGVLYQIQNDLDCYRFEDYFESEDYTQNNITLPIVILCQYLDFNVFSNSSSHQENYNRTKELIFSKKFEAILQNITKKYYEIVASNLP